MILRDRTAICQLDRENLYVNGAELYLQSLWAPILGRKLIRGS